MRVPNPFRKRCYCRRVGHRDWKQGDFECRQPTLHSVGSSHRLTHGHLLIPRGGWPLEDYRLRRTTKASQFFQMHHQWSIWQSSPIRWRFPRVNACPQQFESDFMFSFNHWCRVRTNPCWLWPSENWIMVRSAPTQEMRRKNSWRKPSTATRASPWQDENQILRASIGEYR